MPNTIATTVPRGLKEYNRAAKEVQDAADTAEQRAIAAAHNAHYGRQQAWLDARVPGLDRFSQLEALGGYRKAGELARADGVDW